MDRFFVFIFGIPAGVALIVYRYQVKQFMGNIAWAEQYLGMGGTYTAIVLIGIVTVVLSILYAFGTLQTMLYESFGRFFGF